MLHILYVTIEMMALTFVIGFVVAAIIKSIAYATDSIEFYNVNKEEIDRLERMRYKRLKRVKRTFADENRSWVERDYGISRGRVVQELNDEMLNVRARAHRCSHRCHPALLQVAGGAGAAVGMGHRH